MPVPDNPKHVAGQETPKNDAARRFLSRRHVPGSYDGNESQAIEDTTSKSKRSDILQLQSETQAIILGGQPGAGKGGLTRAAEKELVGDVVKIDPDELRNYHPSVKEFQSTNPYTWSGRTHADASQRADELRNAAVAGKKNIIFDTTLSNGQWTSELIKDLQAKGYDVQVRAMAAHKLESEHGVISDAGSVAMLFLAISALSATINACPKSINILPSFC